MKKALISRIPRAPNITLEEDTVGERMKITMNERGKRFLFYYNSTITKRDEC